MARILIVEDEDGISGALKEWLEDECYVVQVEADGKRAAERLEKEKFELLILDWMLPSLSGIDLCKQYRAAGGISPILLLTAKSSLSAKEEGLDSGADDYLTKPFNMREVSARVRALLRRPQNAPVSQLKVGNLTLDRNSREVTKSGEVLRLLPKEFILLEVLMNHAGSIMSTDKLIDHVWGSESNITPETVRSHVRALRKKIDAPGAHSLITTIHAMGYKLEK